jgi:hypothetical protein
MVVLLCRTVFVALIGFLGIVGCFGGRLFVEALDGPPFPYDPFENSHALRKDGQFVATEEEGDEEKRVSYLWIDQKRYKLSLPDGVVQVGDVFLSDKGNSCAAVGRSNEQWCVLKWSVEWLPETQKPHVIIPLPDPYTGINADERYVIYQYKEPFLVLSGGPLPEDAKIIEGNRLKKLTRDGDSMAICELTRSLGEYKTFLAGSVVHGNESASEKVLWGSGHIRRKLPTQSAYWLAEINGMPAHLCGFDQASRPCYWVWESESESYVRFVLPFPEPLNQSPTPAGAYLTGRGILYKFYLDDWQTAISLNRSSQWVVTFFLGPIRNQSFLGEKKQLAVFYAKTVLEQTKWSCFLMHTDAEKPLLIDCDTWLDYLNAKKTEERVMKVYYVGAGNPFETGIYVILLGTTDPCSNDILKKRWIRLRLG